MRFESHLTQNVRSWTGRQPAKTRFPAPEYPTGTGLPGCRANHRVAMANGRRIGSKFAVIAALVAVILPLLAPIARADDFPPQLLSFTRTSPDLLLGNQPVTIEFAARDDGGAGLTYAMFTFASPLDGSLRVDSAWMDRATEGTFRAVEILTPWAASGTYRLVKVEIDDREGNRTIYERDTSTGFDFAAADFTVDNPLEDTTAPVITSASLFQSTVLQGTPVVILYGASDNLSGVKEVVFSGWSPDRGQYWVTSLPELGAVGPAAWVVPIASPSGLYENTLIQVHDRAGNYTTYQVGYRASVYPPKAALPQHDYPDPASLSFNVEGSTGDRVSPEITSMAPITPNVRHLADIVAIDYSAFDSGTGVAQIAAQWTDGKGHVIDANKTCGDLTHGPMSTRIEDYRTVGSDWTLQSVAVSDYLYNQTDYFRDGRVAYQGGDAGPLTHDFDFSAFDFRIEDGPPSESDIPDTTAQYCPLNSVISLELDDPLAEFGQLVTIGGQVDVGDNPVDQPLVAIHEYIEGQADLVGVVVGDALGQYHETLVAHEISALTATFLGSDLPKTRSGISVSKRVALRVAAALDIDLSRHRIRRGRSTTLIGKILPSSRDRVALQRKTSAGWQVLARTSPDADGTLSFSVTGKNVGSFRYRVTRPALDNLANSRSEIVTLRVVRG